MALTVVAVWVGRALAISRQRRDFAEAVASSCEAVQGRVDTYISLLRGTAGLFAASEEVTRDEFRRYVARLGLARSYPGVRALGYAPVIRADEEPAMEARMREEGLTDFGIWPRPTGVDRTPVAYVEPRTAENLPTLGFDMSSDPARSDAMALACDEGAAWASMGGPGSGGGPAIAEFMIYLPVYAAGVLPNSPAARREALEGFVFGALGAREFFASVLQAALHGRLGVRVYAGRSTDTGSLLHATAAAPDLGRPHVDSQVVSVAGREWTLQFHTLPGFGTPGAGALPWTLGAIGLIASVAMLALSRGQVAARLVAERHAEELRRSDARARESAARREAVMETALDGILTVDQEGRIVDFNQAAALMFGFTREQVMGRPVWDFPLPALRGLGGEQGADEGVVGRRSEQVAQHADGSRFPCELGVTVTRLESGRRLLTAYVRDITKRRMAEDRLRALTESLEERVREATAQLRAANRELEAFAYTVSHDLRAPLRHIAGFTERLLRRAGEGLDAESREDLMLVMRTAREGAAFVEEILNFSQASRAEVKRVPFDMNVVVDEARRRLVSAPGREVEWKIAPLPTVRGDPALLRVVMDNLLGNAVKYSQAAQHPRIEVGATTDLGQTVFYVRDNGVGFEQGSGEQIFEAFERCHCHGRFEGTGVGLATVRRIVQRHGGRTWAEGREGEGATFFFTIPADAAPPAGPEPSPDPATRRPDAPSAPAATSSRTA